ncbi:hypothetical protein ANMWB30_13240 [Arthrobacter sp. MWB30]|nr:hypothetical protein ANMWB30_13240 [Arthrobacter sp. MWB30]
MNFRGNSSGTLLKPSEWTNFDVSQFTSKGLLPGVARDLRGKIDP